MADQVGTGAPIFGPDVKAASQVSIGIAFQEVVMTLGVSRVVLDPVAGLPAPGQQAVEWQATYSLSPLTAMLMRDALRSALDAYEQTFGKLPLAPTAALTDSRA